MADKKEIGKLFRERLKDFEQAPTKTTWEGLESALHPDRPSNRSFWIPVLAAAVFMLSVVVPLSYYQYLQMQNSSTPKTTEGVENCNESEGNETNKNAIVKTDIKTIKSQQNENTHSDSNEMLKTITSTSEKSLNYLNKDVSRESSDSLKKEKFATIDNRTKTQPREKTGRTNDNTTPITNNSRQQKYRVQNIQKPDRNLSSTDKNNKNLVVATPPSVSQITTDTISKEKRSSISKEQASIINTQDSIKVAVKKDSIIATEEILEQASFVRNLRLGAHIFPTQPIPAGSKFLLNNSSISLSEKGKTSIGVGAYLEGEMTDELSVRIGVNFIEIKSETDDITASDSLFSRLMNNGIRLFFNENAGNRDIRLSHTVSYLEIPFDFRYKIMKNRISPFVSAGFSFLYHQNSVILIKSGSQQIGSGDQRNILEGNISLRLGLGVQYRISDRFFLNAEPTFSHFLFNYKDSRNYRPSYMNFQLGFSYKF